MKPLDTSVKGSPGTLAASADFLERYANALDGTGDDLNKVNNTREADWHGPASDECGEALARIDTGDVDELTEHVRKTARSERDFQHALNAVVKQMHHAIDVAHGTDLPMKGPLIMPPTAPGPAPKPPSGATPHRQDTKNRRQAEGGYGRPSSSSS